MTRSIILAGRRRRKRKEKKETKKRKEAKENKAKNKREKQKKNVKVKKINIYKYIATWPFLAGCIVFLLRDILPEEKQIRLNGLQLMQIFFRLAFRLLIRLQKRRSGRPFFVIVLPAVFSAAARTQKRGRNPLYC